jgi:plastocyanin
MGEMPGMTPSGIEPSPTPASVPGLNADSPTPTAGQGTSADGTSRSEIQATLREWAIDLSQNEVTAGTVRLVVTNQGQFTHNLTIAGPSGEITKTPNFSSNDGQQVLEVELQPGTYTVLCDIPGHAARGQQVTLTVK